MLGEIKETFRKIQLTEQKLRWFGIVVASLFLFLFFVQSESGVIRDVILAASILSFALALFVPRAVKPIWMTVMIVTFPIGWLIFRSILILCFYLIVVPLGLGTRFLGFDLLKLKCSNSATYWEDFEENQSPDKIGL